MTDHHLTHEQICDHLCHHGWLGKENLSFFAVNSAVSRYQEYHRLVIDGDCACVTQTRMLQTTCGTKEADILRALRGGGIGCQWPTDCSTALLYYADFTGIRGISVDRAHVLYRQSLDVWEAVCGIKVKRTPDRSRAHWTVGVGRQGMSGPTLAWATLPIGYTCRDNSEMRFNISVTFDEPLFFPTAVHENGHIFGLYHNLSCDDLMCAYLNGKETIGQWSIDRIVTKYGKPAPPDDGFKFRMHDALTTIEHVASGDKIQLVLTPFRRRGT